MMSPEQENYCFVCGKKNPKGLKVDIKLGKGNCEFYFKTEKEYEGWKNIIHGGIIATLLDEAMVWACSSIGYKTVTAELNVRFKKPLQVGETVKVKGEIKEIKKKLIIAVAIIEKEKEIYATGEGKFFIVE